jgi:hypothetical protein
MPFFGGGGSAGIGGSTGATDNAILRADGTGAATLQNSDLNVEDASTATQNNVAITNQHSGQTNSSLVLCNKGTGGFIVSPARPDGTSSGGSARGAESVCMVLARDNANQVASGGQSIAIGKRARASADSAIALGDVAHATAIGAVRIGGGSPLGVGATGIASFALGWGASSTANRATAIGSTAVASIPAQVSFSGGDAHHQTSIIMWAGTTTNATQTEILCSPLYGNSAAVVPARKCWFGQLYITAGNSAFTKYLVGSRLVGIYRDNSNNTTLLGTVQTIGADQTVGAPSWTIDIDANDTNDSLRIRVTGEASTTIYWRVIGVFCDALIGA